MFKRFLVALTSALLILIGLSSPALAQNQSLFFGEYHNYSVTFKEDGEAVIYARIIFTNSSTSDKDTYTFKSLASELKEVTVLQVKLPQECADYTQVYDPILGKNTCSRYKEPNYNSYYYSSYGAKEEITYQRAEISNDGLIYKVNLPQPLQPEKTTALLVAYTSQDYTSNNLFAKTYKFPTLSTDSRISETKIGISVDEGLVLQGAQKNGYCSMGMCPEIMAADSGATASAQVGSTAQPVSNRNLDTLYSSIGSGQRTYEVKSLSPNKFFNAEGRYASSALKLNSTSILISTLSVIFFLVFIVFLSIRLRKKYPGQTADTEKKWLHIRLLSSLVPVASLLPVAGLIGLTLYLSSDNFSNSIWNDTTGTGRSLISLLLLLIYVVLICTVPAIYGIKHGWRALISLVIAQTIWATILLGIIVPFLVFSN